MGEDLLDFYVKEWEAFKVGAKVADGMMHYLNRHWVRTQRMEGLDVYEIMDLSMMTWRDCFLYKVRSAVTNAALSLIERSQGGTRVRGTLFPKIVGALVELDESIRAGPAGVERISVYQELFEAPFLEQTETFYETEAAEFLLKNSLTDYVSYFLSRMSWERMFVRRYLLSSTSDELNNVLSRVFIGEHLDELHSLFKAFLEEEKKDQLAFLYQIIKDHLNDTGNTESVFGDLVLARGLAALRDLALAAEGKPVDHVAYVTAIIAIYKHFQEILRVSLDNDKGFVQKFDVACASFVNKNAVTESSADGPSASELLAKYADCLLRKSAKAMEDDKLDEALCEVMSVFKFIVDKDVFQKFYTKLLAKRLIAGCSVSDDAEAAMISKLREACGFEYTAKLHKMFQDVTLSKSLSAKYKEHQRAMGTEPKFDFHVNILTLGSWPLSVSDGFNLPEELEQCQIRFYAFYATEHSGRKLTWLLNISRGELMATCFKATYTFQVSTLQMAVLMLFNARTSYSVKEIVELTNVNQDTVLALLDLLVKTNLLRCAGGKPSDGLKPETTIELFEGYKNKKLRVNINAPLKIEVQKERVETYKNVEMDRELMIQAAIVRIMKMRKELSHQLLVGEVISQLSSRFNPKIIQIKKCVSMLIEKEYIDRHPEQTCVYIYKA